MYATVDITYSCTQCSCFEGIGKHENFAKNWNLLGSNERAWSVVLPGTYGFENCPQWAIKGWGKTCLFWVKNKMVSFDLYFELFIEILFYKWGFSYSSYFLYKNQTNTISFFSMWQVYGHLKLFFRSYRMVFGHSHAFCIHT